MIIFLKKLFFKTILISIFLIPLTAPEVVKGQKHNKAVDWWSLGTLIFEMLSGLVRVHGHCTQSHISPFVFAHNTSHIRSHIRSHIISHIAYHTHIHPPPLSNMIATSASVLFRGCFRNVSKNFKWKNNFPTEHHWTY